MRRLSLVICIALLLLLVITFRITTAQTVFICRPGETYGLSGHGPPRTAVLLYFDDTAVGGSTTDAGGNYHVRMVVGREAPGDYALEVRVRGTRQVLATALCHVPDPRAEELPASEPAASPAAKIAPSATATVIGAPTQQSTTVSRATSTGATQTATATSATTASATATSTATPSLTATNLGGATSTPSATGATATNTATNTATSTPSPTTTATNNTVSSNTLSIDVDDNEPTVGGDVIASGDLEDVNGNGIKGQRINVTYAYTGVTGQWCSADTDDDGAWVCDATKVPAAMQDQNVTLTAQVTINGNGQTLTETVTIRPVSE